MRVRRLYLSAVPALYLLAALILGRLMAPLPDDVWERVWWPAVIASLAAVFLPTTAWLARRPGPGWVRTTALNAAAGHAIAALLLYSLTIYDLTRPRRSSGESIHLEVPSVMPGTGEIIVNGLLIVLAAAAVASLLSIPLGAACRAVAAPAASRE